MLTHVRRHAVVLALISVWAGWLCGSPAGAAALPKAAQDYIALRAKTQAVVDLSLRDLRARVGELRGKVVEIAGTITGTMSRRGEDVEGKRLISFLLSDGRGGSVIIRCTEGIPEVRPQNKVRVLARLDNDADALDFVPLLAIVREADLPKQWREGAEKPAAAAPRQAGHPSAAPRAGSTPAPQQGSGKRTPTSVGPETVTTVITPTTPKSAQGRPASPKPTGETSDFDRTVAIYAELIGLFNPELTAAQRDLIARCILVFSPQHNLDHRLVFAMVACESNFNPLATSPKGAMGLGQLMPGTAAGLGVTDAYDIVQNLRGSIRYLSAQIHRYAGRSNYDMFCLGMASYNAGPNRVAALGAVPNIPETIRYVNRVAKLFKELHDKGYP